MTTDTFSTYNPLITFLFFIGAIVYGVIYLHPVFLLCGLLLSAAYYITIRRREAWRLLVGVIPLFVLLSLLNPLFNTGGTRILFTWWGGRPYTLEALFYGTAIAAMVVLVFFWFGCYNAVMTSDKFIYLFGRMIPGLSMILTMILRLLPSFRRKTAEIMTARKCIGQAGGSKKERLQQGMTVLSVLTSWALEGGIIAADSMQSRGYGSGSRTSFSIYRFENRDKLLLGVLAALMAVILYCGLHGGMRAAYTPELMIAGNSYTLAGSIAYALFLVIPTTLNIMEAVKWHILRSRI